MCSSARIRDAIAPLTDSSFLVGATPHPCGSPHLYYLTVAPCSAARWPANWADRPRYVAATHLSARVANGRRLVQPLGATRQRTLRSFRQPMDAPRGFGSRVFCLSATRGYRPQPTHYACIPFIAMALDVPVDCRDAPRHSPDFTNSIGICYGNSFDCHHASVDQLFWSWQCRPSRSTCCIIYLGNGRDFSRRTDITNDGSFGTMLWPTVMD